ncbi:MAG: DUF523 and DUF1722 domain-containing protein [Deltaproteobacteria bacterium]|nr:DUF523 and DUF1722 domain-containing protein [Deltaproteobacteria bacterium]
MGEKIRLGISSCLLGENVRYDGGHKLDRFLTDTFGQYVEYVPVCPEVECGMDIPREVMHLEGDPESPRLVTSRTHRDYTDQMVQWARKRVKQLQNEDLCGFIFKSKSPSSGMERVKVINKKGMPVKKGRGLFAGIFMAHFPRIPVEEEGRLHDPKQRENFIEGIFAMRRWRALLAQKKTAGKLVDFHTREKLLIRSHSEKNYTAMGKLVAKGKGVPAEKLFDEYESMFMGALKLRATTKKNTHVLMHVMGHFKKQLAEDEKQEILDITEQYREGYVPLIVPLTLLNHYVRKYDQTYLNNQTYLNPHPIALQLRNHV